MIDPQKLAHREKTREHLFTERYERLLTWALRLTNQHRASAEDLVQDAFIQFTRARTSLDSIENLDGYLRGMLRNMHISRISRWTQQVNENALSLADYDSFDLSWNAVEIQDRMQAQEQLRQICRYACIRKETSRAGSVLILRFLHDYSPSEIGRVLCSSRHCADQWQRLARREVKLYLDNPGQLRFVTSQPPMQFPESLAGNGILIDELRRMVFFSRKGECLTSKQLKSIYQLADVEAFNTSRLGHIVSCRRCLDSVNELLGLPTLAERYYAEPHNDEPPPDRTGIGGGETGGGPPDLETKYRSRLRTVVEHKPGELRIFVNGSQISSLRVGSELSELDLNLGHNRVEFIEVLSEQNIQLLFLSIGDLGGSTREEWARIELNESRTLDLTLSFKNGCTLRVAYCEPLLDAAEVTPLRILDNSRSKLSKHKWQQQSDEPGVEPDPLRGGLRAVTRFARGLFNFSVQSAIWHETAPETSEGKRTLATEDLLFGKSLSPSSPGIIWTNPAFLTVVLSLIMVGALLLFRASTMPVPTASGLLAQAIASEEIMSRIPAQLTHRLIDFEERRGAIVIRRKIEIWENPSGETRFRRVYDENQQLIAGAWEKADGSRIIYHHGAPSSAKAKSVTVEGLLLNLEDIWQLELSAKEFRALIARAENVKVEEQTSSYLIRSESDRTIGATKLLKATLVLSRAELHAVEQSLEVERAGHVHTYRFTEALLRYVPAKTVSPTVFEPEPELLGKGRKQDANARMTVGLERPPLTHALSVASPELEIDVAYLLNQAKGDRNEQVTLSRTANGSLLVEGVVDTDQRKDEFFRALAQIENNPLVTIQIRTIAEELLQYPASTENVVVRDLEQTSNLIPLDKELRAYFSRNMETLEDNNLDEAVRSFSSNVVNRTYRALFHAIELRNLINRFSSVDMRTVVPNARGKWLAMLHKHAVGFERETALFRKQIQPVFFADQGQDALADRNDIFNDTELNRAVERLHKRALANNEAIRNGFTISAQASKSTVKSTAFLHSLLQSEKLALQITQYTKSAGARP